MNLFLSSLLFCGIAHAHEPRSPSRCRMLRHNGINWLLLLQQRRERRSGYCPGDLPPPITTRTRRPSASSASSPTSAPSRPTPNFRHSRLKRKFITATEDSLRLLHSSSACRCRRLWSGHNETPEFHQGAAGYARYYWHSFVDQASENYFVEFIGPTLHPPGQPLLHYGQRRLRQACRLCSKPGSLSLALTTATILSTPAKSSAQGHRLESQTSTIQAPNARSETRCKSGQSRTSASML